MWKTGETSASSVRLGRLMQTSLPAIAQAARREKTRRFRGLYSMLNRANFEVAFRALRRKASAGVDGVTCDAYERDLQGNLAVLEQRLKEKRYRANHEAKRSSGLVNSASRDLWGGYRVTVVLRYLCHFYLGGKRKTRAE